MTASRVIGERTRLACWRWRLVIADIKRQGLRRGRRNQHARRVLIVIPGHGKIGIAKFVRAFSGPIRADWTPEMHLHYHHWHYQALFGLVLFLVILRLLWFFLYSW